MTTAEQNEQIRAYLTGAMSPQQREQFEIAFVDDPDLAEAVEAERQLRIGLREHFERKTPSSSEQGD